MRIASLWSLDLEVVAGLLHLWLSLITFMVVQVYYIYGQILLHLWLVDLLHLWLKVITFMVNIYYIIFIVGITFMGDKTSTAKKSAEIYNALAQPFWFCSLNLTFGDLLVAV